MTNLTQSQSKDLEKILNSINGRINAEWIVCAPELESEAKRIAKEMVNPCTVHVLKEEGND